MSRKGTQHRALAGRDIALYVAVVLMWGSTWIALRFQVENVAPGVSLLYRFMIAAPVMFIWVAARGQSLRFGLKAHVYFASLGLCLFSGNFLFLYTAAKSITSGLLAVVFSTASLMNILNGALWLKTPVLPRQIVGGLLGFGGLGFVFWPEIAGVSEYMSIMGGLAFALLGTFFFSLGNMSSARGQKRGLPLLPSTAWGMAYGCLILLGFVLVSGAEIHFDPRPVYALSLIYLALIGSVAAATAYLSLLGRIGPTAAAYTTVLYPVVALMISTVLEGYVWSWPAMIGLGLVFSGNLIVLRRGRG
ncbi:MAG TPA: EamA family transporter [Rhizobiales bacterium]|nr:EamA family transporter [Hyphomicrobiales bacterium]